MRTPLETSQGPTRRQLLIAGACALLAIAAGWPLLRRLAAMGPELPPTAPDFTDAGALEGYSVGRTAEVRLNLPGLSGEARPLVYVRRKTADDFQVLSSVCPHRACTVGFLVQQNMYRCPCHNSWFGQHGDYGGGPAPRNMDPLPWRIRNGRLFIRWQLFRPDIPQRIVV